METRSELREFLVSRRAKITPEQAKLPAYGGNRRVKGLRREEVAMLAGVSVDYYTKLERGAVGVVSESVLEAVARALQLSPAERDHLYHLTGIASRGRPHGQPKRAFVRPAIQRILDGLDAPAFVATRTRALIATNALGRAVFAPLYEDAVDGAPNTVRFFFFDDRAREFFLDWPSTASDVVANLRRDIGADPLDRDLGALIDDLNRESAEFRRLWRSHDVRFHDTGLKSLHHPIVGDLHLTFEAMELPTDPGQSLIVYGAEPASETAERLRLLASWTTDREVSRDVAD